jgi:hypothetical protein
MSKPVERPRFAMRVEAGRLIADDAYAQEQIDLLPTGRLMVEADTEDAEDGARNKFMAGIGLLYHNIDETGPGKQFPTERQLRRFILTAINFAEPLMRVDGIKMDPRSQAKGEITYAEWVTITELTRAYCVEKWGFDPIEAWEQEKDAEAANRRAR